jgi:hypothetical protein
MTWSFGKCDDLTMEPLQFVGVTPEMSRPGFAPKLLRQGSFLWLLLLHKLLCLLLESQLGIQGGLTPLGRRQLQSK